MNPSQPRTPMTRPWPTSPGSSEEDRACQLMLAFGTLLRGLSVVQVDMTSGRGSVIPSRASGLVAQDPGVLEQLLVRREHGLALPANVDLVVRQDLPGQGQRRLPPLRPIRVLDLQLQLVVDLKQSERLNLVGSVEDESSVTHLPVPP